MQIRLKAKGCIVTMVTRIARHVQRFASAILIDFVVITLCCTCFTLNSAESLVVVFFDAIKTDYQR